MPLFYTRRYILAKQQHTSYQKYKTSRVIAATALLETRQSHFAVCDKMRATRTDSYWKLTRCSNKQTDKFTSATYVPQIKVKQKIASHRQQTYNRYIAPVGKSHSYTHTRSFL